MTHQLRRSRLLLTSSILAASILGAGAAIAADQTFQFDIPAESLGQALTDFSRVSSEQIVFSEDAVSGKKTVGLHGRYSASDALNALLAGTELRIEVGANGIMMVRPKNAQAASNEGAGQTHGGSIETVTVTGTHLRDVESLTPVTTITAVDLTNQGYATLTDALEQLPANSKAGASSASNTVHGFGNGGNNYSFASGVDLRGLGPSDTLVLLNGRRLPSTGAGTLVDISGIPVSAIDRVEILDDGASAIYGSDAVAGVVNIITKSDYEGVETGGRISAADGKAPDLGGYILGGFNWGTGDVLLNYDYEDQKPLYASKRSFTNTAADPTILLPQQGISSVYGSIHQQILPQLQFSADGIFSNRKYVANDSIGAANLLISSGANTQYAGSAELDYSGIAGWTFSLVGQIAHEHDNATITYTGYSLYFPQVARSDVKSIEAGASGDLFSLAGGDVKLATGVSERSESFNFVQPTCHTGGTCSTSGIGVILDDKRNVFSAYAELLVPLVGSDNRLPLVESLRVDAAVRYDHYSDFGGTTNPKVTVEWIPVADLALHGDYSTSFKAPTLFQTAPQQSYITSWIYFVNPADPAAGNAIEYYYFSNPNLKPETAVTFSGGATYQPSQIPGLKLEASYYNIDYRNEVENLISQFAFTNLLNGQLGDLINTHPTLAQINSTLAASSFVSCFTANCDPSTITTIANLGTQNTASVKLDGVDFSAQYVTDTDFGHISLGADGTYFLSYVERVTPTASPAPGAGVTYAPPRFRGKFNISWNEGAWGANARVNYSGPERSTQDLSCPGGCHVASWTTLDLAASYAFQDVSDASFMNGARLNLSVANVFDADPPYTKGPAGFNYDPINANPLGRVITLSLVKRW